MRKEISSLERGILLAEDTASKTKEELEAAEAKLEVVDGQQVPAEKPGRLKRLKGYVDRATEEVSSLKESLEAKEALLLRALEENKVYNLSQSLLYLMKNILIYQFELKFLGMPSSCYNTSPPSSAIRNHHIQS